MMYRSTLLLGLAALAACTAIHSTESSETSAPSAAKMSPETAGTKSALFPYQVTRSTLPNGLKVMLVPMPAEGLVSYWSIVRTGSRDEVEPGVTGFAHFFEHMMFRGSEKFPSEVYDGIVNGMGADANAFTTDDFTAYHLSFSKSDLPKVIEIEADRFQNLKYTEDQFKTEAGAVYGEYRKGRTSPFEVLFEAVQDAAFDKHTYKHTTIGFEADVKKMPEQYAYSKTFFDRFYRPENVVLLVAGDFDPKQALAEIQNRYGSWKKGYTAPKVPTEPEQTAQRRIDVEFDGQTLPLLAINFKGDALKPSDRMMMAAMLTGELAFGDTSRLYKKLVLEEQRLDALMQGFGFNRDPGLWSVIARVKDAGDLKAIEAEIWSEIAEITKTPVSAERLAAVRSNMKYSFLTRLATPAQVAQSLAQLIAITGDIHCIDDMYATLDSVTPADVQKAASHYLTTARSTVAILQSKQAMAALPKGAEARAASAPMSKGNVTEKPVLLPVEQDPNVAFRIWFKVGTQNDPVGKEGLAALTAAMISDGGTEKMPYEMILERMFPLAASYGASVDKEMTIVSGTVHRDNVEAYYPFLIDAVVHPGFRKSDFERLRDQAISNIENQLRYSSDEELGKAVLYERVFGGSRYAHLDEGTVQSLKSITLDDVKSFYKTYYTRDNVVVGLGGSYKKTLPQEFESQLGALPAGKPAEIAAPKTAAIEGRRVTLVEKPGQSTAISFGYPIDLHRGSRDFYAMWIANSWLGEHRNSSSHLYQVIREARGMNYGDYSYIEAYPNGGRRTKPPTGVGRRSQIFEVWLRPVATDQSLFALRAALYEIEKLAKNGLTKEEFEYTKKFLKNYSLHFAETTSERLGYAIDDRYFGVDGHLAKFRKMMDEITLDEVNAAIKKYIQVENLEIVMVTEDAAAMKAKIVSDAPSPITYPAGVTKPEAQLAEDKIFESYPLRVPAANIEIVPVAEVFEGTKAQG